MMMPDKTLQKTFSAARFDFDDAEIFEAARENRLLAMEIEFNRVCNYRCPYCYAGEPDGGLPCMSSAEIDSVIRQAAELGARKLVILGGEPLLYKELESKLDLIEALGMGTEIFTNGALLTPELGAMLFAHRARVVLKLNSLQPAVQEAMTGVPGALAKALGALDLLRQAGYTEPGLLAASSVISSLNVDGMAELWRWLRIHDVIPYFEIMTPQGRMLRNRYLHVDPRRLREVFEEIAAIDQEFGREWTPQPPLVGGKCFRHLYSCVVNADGDVMPCVGVTSKLGNIRERRIADILADSAVIRDLKNRINTIKGPCGRCAKKSDCYGCRGSAYQMTGDYLASDPLCWLNVDRLDEIGFLPCDARPLLPHAEPMAMIEQIVHSGEETELAMTIRSDNRFLNGEGEFDAAAWPEVGAQAAAAAEAFRKDGRIQPGMLAGVRDLEVLTAARVGDTLKIFIHEQAVLDVWHVVRFRIEQAATGVVVATGELKLCVFQK